jgi:putative transposase
MSRIEFKLTTKDREFLVELTKSGKRNSSEFERAYILLALDKEKKHEEIQDFYNVSRVTIWRVKKKYLNNGVEEALKDETRSGQPIKYDDKAKAEIVALACTKSPDGRSRWTLRLLEENLKQRKGMETINRESIRLVLKKTNVSLG